MTSDASTMPLFRHPPPAADDPPTVRVAATPDTDAAPPAEMPPPPAGAGRLVRLAWPLLNLNARIVAGSHPLDTMRLREGAASLVRDFERAALADGVNARDTAAARYVLCAALDEAVLTAPWGLAGGWSTRSLLSQFHDETWGGEKVFTLIDRALRDPIAWRDLLELCQTVLLLGFQGRHRLEREGAAATEKLRTRLRQALASGAEAPPPLPLPQPAQAASRPLFRYIPVWAVAAAAALVAAIAYGWLDLRLITGAAEVASAIAKLPLGGG